MSFFMIQIETNSFISINYIKKPTADYLKKKFNKNQKPIKDELNKTASNTKLN